MGNTSNCDTCSGNMRNQMNMRRQRNTMNENYARSQMMNRTQTECDDDCSRNRDMLYGMPLGMAYVPWQHFECTYEPAEAFQIGTIFPELDKPFLAYGRRGNRS